MFAGAALEAMDDEKEVMIESKTTNNSQLYRSKPKRVLHSRKESLIVMQSQKSLAKRLKSTKSTLCLIETKSGKPDYVSNLSLFRTKDRAAAAESANSRRFIRDLEAE